MVSVVHRLVDKVTLTGRHRCRALGRPFRRPLLVVEVEEQVFTQGYECGTPIHGTSATHLRWRDARVEDLGAINFAPST